MLCCALCKRSRQSSTTLLASSPRSASVRPCRAARGSSHRRADYLLTERLSSPATVMWNVIDATAGVLPVTFVDKTKDALPPDWTTNVAGSKMALDRVYGVGGAYDADKMDGLPVGVQVVAGTWEEEKCVGMMRVLDKALGERGFGPGAFVRRGEK